MKLGRRALIDISMIAALLAGLSFLPPDTSLADRRAQGVLRFCVGDAASPLIRDGGPELVLMQAVADRMHLRLQLQEVPSIGRSFNPRDWQVGRGQCDVLGGGLADSATNRDFLTLIPNGQRLGLVRAGRGDLPAPGGRIGVMVGSAGFDRVRLSSWLRAQGLRPVPLANPQKLTEWLGQGGQAIVPTLADLPAGVPVHDLPAAASASTHLAFGLWRGDMTLTRAFRRALHGQLARDG